MAAVASTTFACPGEWGEWEVGKNGWKRHIGRWKIAGKLVWFLKF